MESLYVLIPLSFIVVALGIWLFFWAVNNGQYDDLDGEAERILFDEPDSNIKTEKASQKVCELPGKNKQGLKVSGSKNV
ncbi:cytochrome oxidase maturation protein, cbb3-type [Gammaproteobacteria bacterium 50_400_T64]|nr:cytochrome oxidase maturation protein, cbb3-type [Gammaproteobacteria bacterium 50_400_T64]